MVSIVHCVGRLGSPAVLHVYGVNSTDVKSSLMSSIQHSLHLPVYLSPSSLLCSSFCCIQSTRIRCKIHEVFVERQCLAELFGHQNNDCLL